MNIKIDDIVEVIKNKKYSYAKVMGIDFLKNKVNISYSSSNKITNWKDLSEIKLIQ